MQERSLDEHSTSRVSPSGTLVPFPQLAQWIEIQQHYLLLWQDGVRRYFYWFGWLS